MTETITHADGHRTNFRESKLMDMCMNWTAKTEAERDATGDAFFNAAIAHLSTRPAIDMDVCQRALASFYALYSVPLPEVLVMPPNAAHKHAEVSDTDGIGVSRFYQLLHLVAAVRCLDEVIDPDLLLETEFSCQAWSGILCHEAAIVIPYPDEVFLDSDSHIHRDGAPALIWRVDGFPEEGRYYHHGEPYPSWVHNNPTGEQLRSVRSAEKRRMIQQILGFDKVIELLELKPVDKATIGGLQYEMYESDNRDMWLRMQSPVLLDGTQPWYVEPVHEDCESVREALGWRATGRLGVAVNYGAES